MAGRSVAVRRVGDTKRAGMPRAGTPTVGTDPSAIRAGGFGSLQTGDRPGLQTARGDRAR